MTRIDLTPAEQRQLETTRGSRRSQVAERCHDVLLNAQGWRVSPIGTSCNKGAEAQPALGDPPSPAPHVYGSIEAGWTVDLLRDSLSQHGLHVSDATVRRTLKSGGWVYQRFSKDVPKHAPTAAEKNRVAQIVNAIA
jgi:hypothetical protein